eukprot:CAMPEP_0170499190 /NCGR_PEP_ID=MMETSP0208-20121228/30434_1 /TAXON_ID=197538 /ORGANISM="Strombidium inclinatum, Strain S3" /LENGTH=52 /DNA_ID=CAMNT_0010776647 /DNA_START=152 /DNA_END=310 /DNA_ORIENTATION=-
MSNDDCSVKPVELLKQTPANSEGGEVKAEEEREERQRLLSEQVGETRHISQT